MKKNSNESTKELVKDIFNPNIFFGQAAAISKAHAYDIVVPSLQEENKKLKEHNIELMQHNKELMKESEMNQEINLALAKRVKYLEGLINEYTLKMKANLSGGKVDVFLKEQANDSPNDLEGIL